MSSPSPQFRFNPITGQLDLSDDHGSSGGDPYPGGVVAWTDVTGTSQAMSANNGYTANSLSLVTLTLPSTCPYGKVFRVVGKGIGGWKIAQNAGQTIHYGNVNTTTGVSGFISSSDQYDCVELLCTVANTAFTVINGPQGDLNFN